MCVSVRACKAKPRSVSQKLLLLFLDAKLVLFRDCETIHTLEGWFGGFLFTWETFGSGVSEVRTAKIPHFNSPLSVDNEHNKQAQSYTVRDELRQQSLSQADCSQGITESVLG